MVKVNYNGIEQAAKISLVKAENPRGNDIGRTQKAEK
jgi:hypothetical protein